MAEVYVDMNLATGSNNGTDWANAYQSLVTALNGSNAVSGDNVWVQGSETAGTAQTLNGGTTVGHPVKVCGVKSGTTAEPPATSDLIPGWRTGEARTEANLAYNDGALPLFEVSSGGDDLGLEGQFFIYAMQLESGDDITGSGAGSQSHVVLEECVLNMDKITPGTSNAFAYHMITKNCHVKQKIVEELITALDNSEFWMIGGKYTNETGANTAGMVKTDMHRTRFIGVDFSDAAHTLMKVVVSLGSIDLVFQNCLLNASTAILSGTRSLTNFAIELFSSANVTGKSSGTIQNIDILSDAGDIVEETTAVRTGGADDGGGLWSLAFTPVINGTRDQYYGLVGPWMAVDVEGDGTSQTVTVNIANSGGADYNDDDVYLEVFYPSEGGTAQYDNQTTQMDLQATPSAVTDDTGSTWGTGGDNHQKLEASIAPDYEGVVYCRVVFTKNFGSSPETLYVDPLPEVV